ncbi:MAG TPA: choice-of-anchor B family protein [Saprospiraceae bacterium]|nr:choice-of-anchor B family protein [Saprospiraceae bacterium]
MKHYKYKFILLYVIYLVNSYLYAQAAYHMELLSQVQIPELASSIWGYTDSNSHEYALLGTSEGVRIYSLLDPTNPLLLKFIPCTASIWRELKTAGDFAYIVSESGDGLLIIDMNSLEHAFVKTCFNAAGDSIQLSASHTLYIDEKNYIYLAGSAGVGGFIILDPNQNPMQPEWIVSERFEYMHEVHVYRDTLYAAAIYNGIFSIWDLKDRKNPKRIAEHESSGHFTHSVWIEKDRPILYTTDETSGAAVEAWDVSDPTYIRKTDEFKIGGDQSRFLVPHNVFHKGDKLYVAYYSEGVRILDTKDPFNLLEVAYYDTDTLQKNKAGFRGCWSVYPFFNSGICIASDIENGMYVLKYDSNQPAYLHAKIVDSISLEPIYNAKVTIEQNGRSQEARSNLKGELKTGFPEADSATVRVYYKGYFEKTVRVLLQRNQILQLDIALLELPKHQLQIQLVNKEHMKPIANGKVLLTNPDFEYELSSNDSGYVIFKNIYEQTWSLYAGKWAYQQDWIPSIFFQKDTNIRIVLEAGYEDDFVMDFDWQHVGSDLNVRWKRGDFSEIPIPSSNFPSKDISGDLGTKCLYTDNFDKDESFYRFIDTSYLYSPWMDLQHFDQIELEYSAWAYGGNNSSKELYLVFPDTSYFLESVPERLDGQFNPSSFFKLDIQSRRRDSVRLLYKLYNDPITAQQSIRMMAALDGFKLSGSKLSTQVSIIDKDRIYLFPNPAEDKFFIQSATSMVGCKVSIYNSIGILCLQTILTTDYSVDITQLVEGIYYACLEGTKTKYTIIVL